ncbi:MAG: stage 0 sporulation family protein [Eubacteriales bacterium]|nr:stage 0 sporulation family protein [Eubacteriales bacterium]
MVKVVGVRFRKAGKVYYFDPDGLDIKAGTNVIVETARGTEFSQVVQEEKEVTEEEIVSPLKKVVRVANADDIRQAEENAAREREAMRLCESRIAEHKLDMKLVDVEYTFDNNKILFYFTADGRVDFRELVKDLAALFKTRIELRQIGVRDEAKMTGGIGICGRVLCCNSFISEFQPVSIKMAKEQGLSLNPAKISGICGRLMCCLKYEQEAYEDLISRVPRTGAEVSTKDGPGTVVEVVLLKRLVKVRLSRGNDTDLKIYEADEIRLIKDIDRKDDRESEAELEELKKLED